LGNSEQGKLALFQIAGCIITQGKVIDIVPANLLDSQKEIIKTLNIKLK